MPDIAPVVLLTRPLAQAREFRLMLGEGVRVVISPIFEIQFLDFSVQAGDYQTLIFASRNAVAAAARCVCLQGLNAIAVGERTAQAATGQGMVTTSAGGNADDLVKSVIAANPVGKVLFVRGHFSRGNVAERLKSAGIETESVIAYDQVQQELTVEAHDLIDGDAPVIIPLFSPRAAALVAREINDAHAPLGLIAISQAALEVWDGPKAAKELVADQPNAQAMGVETLRLVRSWA